MKLAAMAVNVARMVLQRVQKRDGAHGQPASQIFRKAEIDTIKALVPTLKG